MFSLYIKGVNKNKVMKIQFCYIMRNEIRFYYIMCNENHIFVVGSCPIPTTTQTPSSIIISNPLTTTQSYKNPTSQKVHLHHLMKKFIKSHKIHQEKGK